MDEVCELIDVDTLRDCASKLSDTATSLVEQLIHKYPPEGSVDELKVMLFAASEFELTITPETQLLLRTRAYEYWMKYSDYVLGPSVDDVCARNILTFPVWYQWSTGRDDGLDKVQPFIEPVPVASDRYGTPPPHTQHEAAID